jgi:hypothetical protein
MEVRLDIQGHHEKLPMFVTKLGCYPIVLGILWLKQHDIVVMVGQGMKSESRELAVGQGQGLGWAGLAGLDKGRGLGWAGQRGRMGD